MIKCKKWSWRLRLHVGWYVIFLIRKDFLEEFLPNDKGWADTVCSWLGIMVSFISHSPGGLGSKHLTRLDWMMGYFRHIKIIIIKDVWVNACVLIEIPEKVSALMLYVSLEHLVTICSPKQKLSTNVVPVLFDLRQVTPWTWFLNCKWRIEMKSFPL